MAIHNVGYRAASAERTSGWTRSGVITATGIRRAWQSKWLRRMLFFAWLPAIWFGVAFFIWEQSLIDAEWRQSDKGRRAKYYSLTRAGRQQLEVETTNWMRRVSAVARLLKAEG